MTEKTPISNATMLKYNEIIPSPELTPLKLSVLSLERFDHLANRYRWTRQKLQGIPLYLQAVRLSLGFRKPEVEADFDKQSKSEFTV